VRSGVHDPERRFLFLLGEEQDRAEHRDGHDPQRDLCDHGWRLVRFEQTGPTRVLFLGPIEKLLFGLRFFRHAAPPNAGKLTQLARAPKRPAKSGSSASSRAKQGERAKEVLPQRLLYPDFGPASFEHVTDQAYIGVRSTEP